MLSVKHSMTLGHSNIFFRSLNLNDTSDLEAIDLYSKVPQYQELTRPRADEKTILNHLNPAERLEKIKQSVTEQKQSYYVIISQEVDHNGQLIEKIIGDMNFMLDPPHLFKKTPGTAWLGIGIGLTQYRGKGIGTLALIELEKLAKRAGAVRLELGVFAFNSAAIQLYQKAGFIEIGRIPNFTFARGQMWDDLRMEKFVQ